MQDRNWDNTAMIATDFLQIKSSLEPSSHSFSVDFLNFKNASAWLKRLCCHTGCQEVSRCCTRGESENSKCRQARDPPWLWKTTHTSLEVKKYQWPHKKDWCPPKILWKVLQSMSSGKLISAKLIEWLFHRMYIAAHLF